MAERATARRPGGAAMIWVLLALTVTVGVTSALQVAMLGAIARERAGYEATWVSLLASLAGMAGVFLATALAGREPLLARPFNRPAIYGFFVALLLVALVLASRGLPWYLALTGFLPVPYLLAASFIGPRLGLGLFLGAIIAGQLIGGIALDHIGAFGATPRRVDAIRLLGVVALLVGVLLIRGRR